MSVGLEPKGEALAWGVFAAVAFVGSVGSYGIRGDGLESTDDGFEEHHDGDEGNEQGGSAVV